MSIRNLIFGVNSITVSHLIRCDSLLQNATAILLQNGTEVYYKMRQVFYYKMRQYRRYNDFFSHSAFETCNASLIFETLVFQRQLYI